MAPDSSTFYPLLVASTIPVLVYFLLRKQSLPLAYPPGPKVKNLPTQDGWVEYQNWGREFGEVIYVQDLNVLILNNSRDAIELLEKRSRIYSDRRATTLGEICGFEMIISVARYSDRWRRSRKLFQQVFRQAAIDRFHSVQYSKVHEFLHELVRTPDNFMYHVMALSQRIVFSALYGLAVNPEDPIAQNSVELLQKLGATQIPGCFPALERFPWLRFMPTWFPGCGFNQLVDQIREGVKETNDVPFDMAVNNMREGKGTSLIAELAAQNDGDPSTIDAIKAMGITSFLAAADTTMSSISSFLLMMILHPNVQIKGQEEIDRVIGRDRLPTFADRLSLPYIEAIYRELMRLHPPIPLGVEHRLIEDDFYLGYHIPKGCSVIANIWAMNRDPTVYSQPDDFLPERFLNNPIGPFTNISNIHAFGFGRRICAGKYMADNSVWLTIACVLATVGLGKPKDKEGNEKPVNVAFTDVFFRHPKPFECTITPRDSFAEKLILDTE